MDKFNHVTVNVASGSVWFVLFFFYWFFLNGEIGNNVQVTLQS